MAPGGAWLLMRSRWLAPPAAPVPAAALSGPEEILEGRIGERPGRAVERDGFNRARPPT